MAYIELQNISKTFDGKQVLDHVDISIEQGEFITLLGASGCGKTTLLRSLAGLEQVESGRILIGGQDMTFTEPKGRHISMIFQQYSLFPTMTVYRNIAFGLKMQKCSKREIDRKVRSSLEMVDLLGSEDKYPAQLSGGEQQRVALARAIVTEARILLLDEPFSAIDAKLRKSLQIKIRDIHEKLGLTSIFVTHDQEEALRMSDRIYLLHDGRVEQSGTPTDLYLEPATPYAAGFMGSYNLFPGKPTWAIRPEAIELSRTPWGRAGQEGYICECGTVHRIIHQGNIIRYTVACPGRLMDVDVLAGQHDLCAVGEEVWLRYHRSQIRSWS